MDKWEAGVDVPTSRWLLERRAEPIRLAALTPPSLDVIEDGGKLPSGFAIVAPDADVRPIGAHAGLNVIDLVGQGLLETEKGRVAGGAEAKLRTELRAPNLPGLLMGAGGGVSIADVEGDDAQGHQFL